MCVPNVYARVNIFCSAYVYLRVDGSEFGVGCTENSVLDTQQNVSGDYEEGPHPKHGPKLSARGGSK